MNPHNYLFDTIYRNYWGIPASGWADERRRHEPPAHYVEPSPSARRKARRTGHGAAGER